MQPGEDPGEGNSSEGRGWRGKVLESGMYVAPPPTRLFPDPGEVSRESRSVNKSLERAEVGHVRCGAGTPPVVPGAPECP